MKNLSFLLLLLISISCKKTELEKRQDCGSECTVIKGRFVSSNNEPVPGVKITCNYSIYKGWLSGLEVREIFKTETDKSGNYNQSFYVRGDELGYTRLASFDVKIDDTTLDSNKYIKTNDTSKGQTRILGFSIDQINRRDTVILHDYYIPKRAFITVNLKDFSPLQQDDYFDVQTFYPYGQNIGYNPFIDSPYEGGFSGYAKFRATNANSQLKVLVAGNEKNIVRIVRRKNGVITNQDFLMTIPLNNNIVLTYNY